ncbi:hypothetical protein COT96_00580 [Candidatus Falkowbacteria bacterium CG10_big_fil_rev_8_21_14_0_10_38_22]|uniref:Peptidase S11 D-alanyl-D-alanine carboxypeptidase A N-terminal domain-containing protein n=1 Tax=Candidatus Falkowbacteria bacterium CG10_big_fil_rev_8_21_14_0_10_38_22 TaxID=1974564 RepID=A0A2M6WRX6_9BACT|nr:MAG: hypothetical protein COT96_00580 [Candidatus Falkowbacteria bacterium CG10_big_fil_rev_8_21_14_0_10_38_22]
MSGRSQMLRKIVTVETQCIAFLLLSLALSAGNFIYAADEIVPAANRVNNYYSINLDQATITKGYTVSAFADSLKLSLMPGILKDSTRVEIVELNEPIDLPWQLDKISKIYQFEFKNKAAYDNQQPFYIQFSYDLPSDYYKQVYFYDKNYLSWRPLPTIDYPKESFVRTLIHLPFARIAVFANPNALAMGQASWYKNKGGLFAASPDFPQKSKLRVYNTDNNKFVDVVVNDFGPDRKLHPGWVVDLDKVAFKKLSPTGVGVINVRLEPIKIKAEGKRILGVSAIGAKNSLEISARSAVLMNEQTGEIIWQKNASSTAPLASLTKLVAVKVFLDLRPTLNQIVAYSIKDEEYNYQYCNKWESAKVSLKDGDTLTIADLLYSALVGSANNAIETLVRVSGLGRQEFIEKMNQTAAGWGAVSTHFVEPTGLSPQNMSSALDYAIITKEIYTHPIIKKASTIAEYKFTTINTKKFHRLKNTNQLINTASNFKITGSKTGYLDEALYCLMIRAEKDSLGPVIAVTMGVADRTQSFNETADLVRYGLKTRNQ